MLGRACLQAFGPDASGCGRGDFDIADRAGVLAHLSRLSPGLIVNCAAATDVDRCELDHGYADTANAVGASHVAEAAAILGARLVHISTDFVFGGREGRPYRETDEPSPLNYYGLSKLKGERAVLAALPSALVVRASWLYGDGPGHFPARVLSWASERSEIRMAADQFGSPTFAEDLARGIRALVATGVQGVFHLAGSGCASRYDVAWETLALAKLNVTVVPVSASEFPSPAPRPANTCLDCTKAAGLGVDLPPWRDGLARYLRTSGIS
ncbi:MAG: dTDP-4-dehydrorhamnose reductase [Actinobacteria bacterium RBG_16_64_13]|nr:MAG: dTDP-4-dehydrorhamnose reductase [Actinobacteria bacterium RBG_16_64_13]